MTDIATRLELSIARSRISSLTREIERLREQINDLHGIEEVGYAREEEQLAEQQAAEISRLNRDIDNTTNQ